MPDQPGARVEPLDQAALRAAIHAGKPDPTAIPDHIRAAIHAGHVAQVVIFCDRCGTEDRADYTGQTAEIRFAAARQHLARQGWRTTLYNDLCPTCAPTHVRLTAADTTPEEEGPTDA